MNVVVVLPAYNAARTLERTVGELPAGFAKKVILVDDGSTDDTVALARNLNLHVIVHPTNIGYGGNQKTCYRAALDAGADIVIMLHPDNQYDARVAPVMAQLISLGVCDMVLGNRIRTRAEALNGGMPLWKYIINRLSTFGENLFLGQSIGDFHSGFRAYSREVLECVNFQANSNDFAFDQEFLIQAINAKFRIGDVPVPVRYMKEASSINFRRSLRYGFGAIGAYISVNLHNMKIRKDPRFNLLSGRQDIS